MIQPLRMQHRFIVFALAAVLPAIIGAALLVRPRAVDALRSRDELPDGFSAVLISDHLWTKLPITTIYLAANGSGQATHILLRKKADIEAADPLLFWSATPLSTMALPRGAKFLGPLDANAPVPFPGGGTLVLYDLARTQVLDTAKLEKLP